MHTQNNKLFPQCPVVNMKKANLTVIYIYIQNTKFVFITDKALKVTYKNDHFTRAKNLQATCSVSVFFYNSHSYNKFSPLIEKMGSRRCHPIH